MHEISKIFGISASGARLAIWRTHRVYRWRDVNLLLSIVLGILHHSYLVETYRLFPISIACGEMHLFNHSTQLSEESRH
jgi:hypothetical protein